MVAEGFDRSHDRRSRSRKARLGVERNKRSSGFCGPCEPFSLRSSLSCSNSTLGKSRCLEAVSQFRTAPKLSQNKKMFKRYQEDQCGSMRINAPFDLLISLNLFDPFFQRCMICTTGEQFVRGLFQDITTRRRSS